MEKKRSKVGYIRRVSIILIIKVFCSAIRKHDLPHHAVSRRRDTESSWKTRPKGSDVVDLRSRKSRPSPRSSRRVPQRWGRAVHPVQERASACLAPSLVSDSFEHGGITNFSPLGAATAHDFNTQTSAKAVRTRFPPLFLYLHSSTIVLRAHCAHRQAAPSRARPRRRFRVVAWRIASRRPAAIYISESHLCP